MKTKLIQTEDYLLLINIEAEIKEGNIAIYDFGMGFELEIPCDKDNLKSNTRKLVIAYYPLTNEAKELDLPLLPNPFEGNKVDVNKLAKKVFEEKTSRIPVPTSFWLREVGNYEAFWAEGYRAAQPKQFSLEDVENILIRYLEEGFISKEQGYINPNSFLKSLSTQQLPKEFIPEYEIKHLLRNPPIEERIFKITVNSEGKEELVGTYEY